MTELGALSHCIVENDLESRTRGRWSRGKSLAISLALEASVVAILLLLPLFAPSALPPAFVVTPAPPYHGEPRPSHRSVPPENSRDRSLAVDLATPRPVFRPVGGRVDVAPPIVAGARDNSEGPVGEQPGILGGANRGTAIHIAPPSVQRAKPLPQSEGVMAARLVRRVQPDYPRIAQVMRLSGIVRLRAIIGTDGSVQQLAVLSGNAILARAALLAVRQWRYEPTRLNGQPVEVETSITVTFILN